MNEQKNEIPPDEEIAKRIFLQIEETLLEILEIAYEEAPQIKIKLYLPNEVVINGKEYYSNGASYEKKENTDQK